MIKRVIFIRPGETDWNTLGRWQGWVASPLNGHGREQAAALARFVRHIEMRALYTSDLVRAVQTADLLAEPLGFAPIRDERLRERNIGAWQGLTRDEMRDWYPAEYTELLADSDNYRPPGGESRADVRLRMVEAFGAIRTEDRGETVGILSHSTAIKVLLETLLPGYMPAELTLENTSVTTLHHDGDSKWALVAGDDISHLEGLTSTAFPELEDRR